MSVLLTSTAVLDLTNNAGKLYYDLVRHNAALDIANSDAQAILAGLATDIASSDPAQFAALVPYITGVYGVAPGSAAPTSSFGASQGIGPGSFGAGQGLLNRSSIFSGSMYAFLEGLRKTLNLYGSSLGITSLSTFAAYQNALTAYSCLFTPDIACAFWYAYNKAQQLAALSVFAPAGIVMGNFAVSGAGAGTFTPGCFPNANGYTLAPLGVYCGAVTITAANTCTTAGLTGTGNSAAAYVSTAVTGGTGSTAVITITDSNGATFTANVGAAAVGTVVAFAPTVAGTLMATPASATVAGTATAGVIQIVEGGPTVDAYGNAVWPGGMPMAQGFAPLKNAVIYNNGAAAVSAGTAITITAPNQAGVSKTWITTLGAALAAGAQTAVTVGAGTAAGTDRTGGTPTAITITGGGAGQSFQVQSGAVERAY